MIVVFCTISTEWKDGDEVRVPKFVHIECTEDMHKADLDTYVAKRLDLLNEDSSKEIKFYGASIIGEGQRNDFHWYLASPEVFKPGAKGWYELDQVRERLHKVCKHNLETYKPFWEGLASLPDGEFFRKVCTLLSTLPGVKLENNALSVTPELFYNNIK